MKINYLFLFMLLLLPLAFASQITLNGATGVNVTIEPNNMAHMSVADDSLVAYYPLDNSNPLTNQTYDYTSQNNDGNLTGYTFNHGTRVNGQNQSFFDGINDYVNLGLSSTFQLEPYDATICTFFNSIS
jgi:hypothetical protein